MDGKDKTGRVTFGFQGKNHRHTVMDGSTAGLTDRS